MPINHTFDGEERRRGDAGHHHRDRTPPDHASQPAMNFRTIDGSNNNSGNPGYNATNSDFARIGPANFADGISTLVAGPNPRMISNVVVGQGDAEAADPGGLSGMMYAWGQFIDHDLDLAPSGGTSDISITVPAGDPNFPAGSTIPLTRAITDPHTGAGTGTPATAVNAITGWLDGSMVYGSDSTTAAGLRLPDGHMATSAGNNLPITNGAFAAGDVRAQENPDLTALQVLFVREHNYQVDQLAQQHPGWTGEQLYQQARAIVTAEIEHITYNEFLPHLLGTNAIKPYAGYDPKVDPRITEEFAGAAYRFGHSIVSGSIEAIDNQGNVTSSQDLANVFFEPPSTFAATGADGLLRHLGADTANAMDARIIDQLRNSLADPPDVQDLAAINIQRGRDLGLGTLNETRQALGLAPYTDFSQITSDQGTVAALRQAYGSVDAIDLWTGGLSESHAAGAMVGPTFQAIIARQFENLRDGDRLWYQNQGFDPQTLQAIEGTTLSDIIKRDTDTGAMQADAFVFTDRHTGALGGVPSEDPGAPQLVIGSTGNDVLVGGPQADTLVPAQGDQTLTGLGGADTFVFGQPGIHATITDFDPTQDVIAFEDNGNGPGSPHTFNDIHMQFVQGNAMIQAAGDTIVLNNVDPQQLSPANFILHS